MSLVSIIIVSWNGLHWLKRSLPSIFTQSYTNIEVILVDNSSSDGTVSWVKKHYPQITIVQLQGNEGYAEANNRGYEESTGEYVLFLNNDVEVTNLFLVKLVLGLQSNVDVACVQSKILLFNNPKQLDTIGAFLTGTGFLYHYAFMNIDQKRFDKEINLFTPKGACMLFKKNALEEVEVEGKLFDPQAFAYFEETDLAHRIWLSGKRVLYVPSAIIYHQMGGTSTTIDNAYIQFHSFKNRINAYLKNLQLRSLLFMLPIHLVCCEIFALLYVLRGKPSVSISIQKAIIWNILFFSQTLRKRRYIQKNIRKVSDSWYYNLVYRNPPIAFYIAQAKGIPYQERL